MNRDKDGTWSAEEVEEWLHEEWLRVQEMGDEAYTKVEEEEEEKRRSEEKKKEEQEEMEEDPYEEEERKRWKSEEEEAKGAYLKKIEEEEEKGIYRQTVAEMIEEDSEAKRLKKEIEIKERKKSETAENLKGNEEEDQASPIVDLPTLRPSDLSTDIDAPTQETNLDNPQAVVESLRAEGAEAAEARDRGLQMGDTGQITGGCLIEEKVRGRRGEEEGEEKEEKKKILQHGG